MSASGADAGVSVTPTAIGVVGAAGLFGRWLTRFFASEYPEVEVVGVDAGDDDAAKKALVSRYDLTKFATAIELILTRSQL